MQQNTSFIKIAGGLVVFLIIAGILVFLIFRSVQKMTSPQTSQTTSGQTQTTTQTGQPQEEISQEASGTSSTPPIFSQATELEDELLSFETQAFKKSREWNPQSSICATTIKIPGDLTRELLVYTFIFCAPNQPYYFTMNFNTEGQSLRALVWKTDYLNQSLLPISFETQYKKATQFVKALEIAEQNGGQNFRNSNPNSSITMNLYKSGPNNYLYWFIEYKTQDGSDQLKKQVDAINLQLVTE